MDGTQLTRGQVYNSTRDEPFNRLLHVSGIPKQYWKIKLDNVSFEKFSQNKNWGKKRKKKGSDLTDPFITFKAEDQLAWWNGFIGTMKGQTEWDFEHYAGDLIAVASEPSVYGATSIAAAAARVLISVDEGKRIRWINATTRNRWGYPIGVDWDDTPDFVVITGLTPNPSRELAETVERLIDWGIRYAPVMCVGGGANPIDMMVNHYHQTPNINLYGSAEAVAKETTVG